MLFGDELLQDILERHVTVADRLDESRSNQFPSFYYSVRCILLWCLHVGMFHLWTDAMERNDQCRSKSNAENRTFDRVPCQGRRSNQRRDDDLSRWWSFDRSMNHESIKFVRFWVVFYYADLHSRGNEMRVCRGRHSTESSVMTD